MNSVQKSLALARICARQYSSHAPSSSHFKTLKSKQAKFQADDGLPVFLKGGAMDKILYQSTVVLSVIGMGMCFKLYWDLAVPKKE